MNSGNFSIAPQDWDRAVKVIASVVLLPRTQEPGPVLSLTV